MEQRSLHSGGANDIVIDAPKEPEVNPIIYRDVESLIFRGFLILPTQINGVDFIFKSINHHEFEYIQWVSGSFGESRTEKAIDRYYSTFLSYCIFMIDGENILPNRAKHIPQLQEFFNSLPPDSKTKVIRNLSEVNNRSSNAVTLTKAYQGERTSRFKWGQYRGLNLMSPASNGIPGSDQLGINYAQLVWRALNYYEDLRENSEREWDNSKFIGSCFAGKGVQKIYTQDKDRRQKEKEDRLKKRDQLIRQVMLREDPEEQKKSTRGTMQVARTVDELADQLQKNLRGERDWHDEVVAAEQKRLLDQFNDRKVQLRELAEQREKEHGNLPYMTQSSMEGLTDAEVQQRIAMRKQLTYQRENARMVYPEMLDEKVDTFFEHMGSDDTYQGTRLGTTDRDTSSALPIPPARPRGTPFGR